MVEFNKFDKVSFEVVEKNNYDIKKTKYHYIWGYDEVDQKVLEILKDGKDINDNEKTLKIKKTLYTLKLLSVKKIDSKTKELIEINEFLKSELEKTNLKNQDQNELIKKYQSELEDLKVKSLIETNKFKEEVIAIQKKAQDAINEHKQKNNDHQEIQIAEARKYALQSFIENLIQHLNNFEKAIIAAEKIDNDVLKNFIIGFNMLYKQVENVLFDFGLTKIIPKIGEMFDPNIHQVYELASSDLEKDTILEVKNIGYKLHDRTIKPALVVVSK